MEASAPGAKNAIAEEISGFVLAGGRSSRMGRDKAMLPWQGATLLDHAEHRLRQVCKTVRICAGRTGLADDERFIKDAVPDCGPLGGIVAALERSQTAWNFFLAVDLPLVPVEFLQAMVACVQSIRPADEQTVCIIPQVSGLPQPLCALYRRDLAPGLRDALEGGEYKIMLALREAAERLGFSPASVDLRDAETFIASAKIPTPRNASEWFWNINTPEDWRQLQERNSREN